MRLWAFRKIKSLAILYFRMANCHTIIDAKRFHFRVRNGIGWFTLAMVTKQTGFQTFASLCMKICIVSQALFKYGYTIKLIGCYMVKPHGQLVHVSYIHY